MSLTVCFVTRDHEACLDQAIRSAAALATEVVVADTGSTDNTVAVATGLGARVRRIAWADDFAAACNAALDRATGDWVLWMNPDEELDVAGLPTLAALAARPDTFAAWVRVRQQMDPARPSFGTVDRQLRLFRRDPEVRYRGRLHPGFVTPLEAIAAAREQAVADIDATIVRHTYLSVPTPDKVRWANRLIEKELRDRPGQLRLVIELGTNLLRLNDPHGHEVLAQAAAEVRDRMADPTPPDPDVGRLIEYLLTVSPEQSRGPITRHEARELASRWFPHVPPVVWALASDRFAAGDYPTAAGLLERLVWMGRTGEFDPGGGFTPAIIGPTAVMNLGLCYLHLSRWADATTCFTLLVNEPNYRDAATKGLALAAQQKRPG